ncbi:MAG TPA: AAA family ATPase [Candidatus Dormibacteraeota bacterium]|nr:AAA family ATPase [Candidatus Dormibacteraeota bacterium]
MKQDRPLGERLRGAGGRRIPVIVAGLLLVVVAGAYVASTLALRPDTPGREIRYDELFSDVKQHRISNLTVLSWDGVATGTVGGDAVWVGVGTRDQVVATLVSDLHAADAEFRVDPQSLKQALSQVSTFALPSATLITGFAFLFLLFRNSGPGIAGIGRSRARKYAADHRTGVTFADVAGMDETVEELREVVDSLSDPRRLAALGGEAPRGVLLVGPPGCGKTLLARAVAGEADVPYFALSGSEFTEALVGVGAARMRDLFKRAREAAPAIVFIDELDAIGRARSTGEGYNAEWEATLNELLVQLDGFAQTERVVLLAATNRPDILDAALLRKGRFDRQIVLDVPDRPGRLAIFRVHARGKPLADDVDWERLLGRTVGFTGADVAATMNEAAVLASRRGATVIGNAELGHAVERVVAGPERRSRIPNAEERRRTAYHEAGHALVGWLCGSVTVDKVSLVARGHSLGSTWNRPAEDRCLVTRSQLVDDITFNLAGRAAEQIVFGETSSAAHADLDRANAAATRLVREYGMSAALGPMVLVNGGRTFEHSPEVAARADSEVLRVLTAADGAAESILREHAPELAAVAKALLERETLERAELMDLLGHLETPPATGEPAVEAGDALILKA